MDITARAFAGCFILVLAGCTGGIGTIGSNAEEKADRFVFKPKREKQ